MHTFSDDTTQIQVKTMTAYSHWLFGEWATLWGLADAILMVHQASIVFVVWVFDIHRIIERLDLEGT